MDSWNSFVLKWSVIALRIIALINGIIAVTIVPALISDLGWNQNLAAFAFVSFIFILSIFLSRAISQRRRQV
jgi:hypothetical protein